MSEKLSLYEMTNALEKIEEMVDDDISLATYLDSVQMQIGEKVDNIIRFRRSTELYVQSIDSEIERMEALKKLYDNRNERLKKYLAYCLKKMGKPTFESAMAKMSFRKTKAVDIPDPSKVPMEYQVEHIRVSPDKKKIKEAIEKGIEVEGARIIENENLIIK